MMEPSRSSHGPPRPDSDVGYHCKVTLPTVLISNVASVESRQGSRRGSAASRRGSANHLWSDPDEPLHSSTSVLRLDSIDREGENGPFDTAVLKLLDRMRTELLQCHQDDLNLQAQGTENLRQTNAALRAELTRLRRTYAKNNVLPPSGAPPNMLNIPSRDASQEDISVADVHDDSSDDSSPPALRASTSRVSTFGKAIANSLLGITGRLSATPNSARGSVRESVKSFFSPRSSARTSRSVMPTADSEATTPSTRSTTLQFPEKPEVRASGSIPVERVASMSGVGQRMMAMKRAASLKQHVQIAEEEDCRTFHEPPNLVEANGCDSQQSETVYADASRSSTESGVPVNHTETMFGGKAPKKQKGIKFADEQEEGLDSKGHFLLQPVWSSLTSTSILKRQKTTKRNLVEEEESDSDDDEDFEIPGERVLRRLIIKPNSTVFALWATVGYIALLYDAIVLPLGIFEMEMSGSVEIVGWITRIYWTMNIPITMLSSYEHLNGHVEKKITNIIAKYMRGWFFLDLVLVVLDWCEVFMSSVKNVRYLQLFRMVRLIRLMQVRSMPMSLKKILHANDMSSTFFTVTKNLLLMMWFNHLCACIWFGVGSGGEAGNTWLDLAQESGWNVDSKEFIYVHSYRWQLANFVGESGLNPQTISEYLYLLLTSICAFMAACMFVSSITSAMTRLEIAVAHDHKRFALLRQFLTENHISSKIAMRVTRNAQFQAALQKRRTPEENIDLLNVVSEPLRIDLHFKINMKVLSEHPMHLIYSILSEQVMRQICHTAVSRLHIACGDILFHAEETAAVPHMYFVIDGKLSYYHQSGEFKGWPKGHWACEAVLWTSWIHYGTARARSECTLAMLHSGVFQKYASLDTEENTSFLLKYATSMVQELNDTPPLRLTDLADPEIDLSWYVQKAIPGDVAKDLKKKVVSQMSQFKSRGHSSRHGRGLFGKVFGHTNRGSLGSFTKARGSRLSNSFQPTMSTESGMGRLRHGKMKFVLADNIVDNAVSSRQTRMAGVAVDIKGDELRGSIGSDFSGSSHRTSSSDETMTGRDDRSKLVSPPAQQCDDVSSEETPSIQ